MGDTPEDGGRLPASLRFLKGLVIVLMISMIGGVITVVWLLVTRMPDGRAALPALPPDLVLPAGEAVGAVTFGAGYAVVVTQSQKLLIYDAAGRLRHSTDLAKLPKN